MTCLGQPWVEFVHVEFATIRFGNMVLPVLLSMNLCASNGHHCLGQRPLFFSFFFDGIFSIAHPSVMDTRSHVPAQQVLALGG